MLNIGRMLKNFQVMYRNFYIYYAVCKALFIIKFYNLKSHELNINP
jgi:hypothetical protein